MTTASPPDAAAPAPLVRWLPLATDVVAVLVFVAIGRSAHADGLTVAGLVSTAWPFLVGLGAGWLAVRSLPRGARNTGFTVVWLTTVAVGMVLRVAAGQGTTVVFCLVATAFLGLFLLAGRGVVALVRLR